MISRCEAVCLGIVRETSSINQPNIIFVMADDQVYSAVRVLGHPWMRTPNLDKM